MGAGDTDITNDVPVSDNSGDFSLVNVFQAPPLPLPDGGIGGLEYSNIYVFTGTLEYV